MRIALFRSHSIGMIAALASSIHATMEETVAEPKSDEEFIKQYSAKLDATEKVEAEKAKGEKVKGDEGKEKPVSKEKDEGAADEDDDAAAGGGAKEEDDDADEELEEEEGDDADADADPDADEEKDDDDKGEEKDESEFAKRAKDAKLPTSVDDLPKEARPIVEARLKQMESGFTRLMQKQAEFREEQRTFRTEERYRETHQVEWLVQQLLKDPKLEEQVAAELDKLREGDSPYLREAAAVVAKDHRAKAAKEVVDQEAEERKEQERQDREDREQAEWIAQRGSQVETIARKACSKFGIQFDRGVESAIAYEISESEQGDIDDARIREIVEDMAQERGRSKRAVLREERKREVQGKTEAARRASPIRPGQGRAGGTTRAKPAATLEENFAATAERLFPGEA